MSSSWSRLREMGWRRAVKTKDHPSYVQKPLSPTIGEHRTDIAHVPIVARRQPAVRRCHPAPSRAFQAACIHSCMSRENLTVNTPLLAIGEPDGPVVGRLAGEVKGQHASRFCMKAHFRFSTPRLARTTKRKGRNARIERVTRPSRFFTGEWRRNLFILKLLLSLLLSLFVKKKNFFLTAIYFDI